MRYQNGESVIDICTETGIAGSTFYSWIKQLRDASQAEKPRDFTLKNFRSLRQSRALGRHHQNITYDKLRRDRTVRRKACRLSVASRSIPGPHALRCAQCFKRNILQPHF